MFQTIQNNQDKTFIYMASGTHTRFKPMPKIETVQIMSEMFSAES